MKFKHELIVHMDDLDTIDAILSWHKAVSPYRYCREILENGKPDETVYVICGFESSRDIFDEIKVELESKAIEAEMYTVLDNAKGVRAFDSILHIEFDMRMAEIVERLKDDKCPKKALPAYLEKTGDNETIMFKCVRCNESWKKHLAEMEILAHFISKIYYMPTYKSD